nr:hypothetical protein [Microbispora siamensis]
MKALAKLFGVPIGYPANDEGDARVESVGCGAPPGSGPARIETGEELTVEGIGEVLAGGIVVSHHRDCLATIAGQLADDLALYATPAALLDEDGPVSHPYHGDLGTAGVGVLIHVDQADVFRGGAQPPEHLVLLHSPDEGDRVDRSQGALVLPRVVLRRGTGRAGGGMDLPMLAQVTTHCSQPQLVAFRVTRRRCRNDGRQVVTRKVATAATGVCDGSRLRTRRRSRCTDQKQSFTM